MGHNHSFVSGRAHLVSLGHLWPLGMGCQYFVPCQRLQLPWWCWFDSYMWNSRSRVVITAWTDWSSTPFLPFLVKLKVSLHYVLMYTTSSQFLRPLGNLFFYRNIMNVTRNRLARYVYYRVDSRIQFRWPKRQMTNCRFITVRKLFPGIKKPWDVQKSNWQSEKQKKIDIIYCYWSSWL